MLRRGEALLGPLVRLHRTHAVRAMSTRPTADLLSLDNHLCTTNLQLIVDHLHARRADDSVILQAKKLPELFHEKNACQRTGDIARGQRKALSREIAAMMKAGRKDEVEQLKRRVDESNEAAARADVDQELLAQQINSILFSLPNLLGDQVPDGGSETDNVILHTWGEERRKVGASFKWHDDIAKGLGGLDPDAAAKLSGTRFSVLVGPVARLERALTQFFLDFHVRRGYKEVAVPYIVRRSVLHGTGQLPKFEDDLFKINHNVGGEDAFLIPTAEVPATNIFRDQILDEAHLPVSLVCHSASFRAEAGAYGRDTRGLLRQHQFHKVELIKVCSPQESLQAHEELVRDAEAALEALELPYRRVLLCSGDTGFAARVCYDLEVWLPGQQLYREISSCSNCFDFQSRRMMLRYRKKEDKEVAFPHTLNGSGVAVGRALVAILENFQEEDGSVSIPAVLQPYMGGQSSIQPAPSSFLYGP